MPANDDTAKVWSMMEKIGFCMLASIDRSGGGMEIRSRPMAAYVRPEDNAVWFLTDAESHKDEEIARDSEVNLAFADASKQRYVSVAGRAEVTNDREKVRELWGTPAKAWWDGPDDPSIRVLKVTPKDAQYWDSPGTVSAYIRMAAAALTDGRPQMGEREKVDM